MYFIQKDAEISSPWLYMNPKCRKNPKHLAVLGRYEIMLAYEISKLGLKNFQAQGESAKSWEEKKMDKDNKIMMHYSKVSLGKKALWAGVWMMCCDDIYSEEQLVVVISVFHICNQTRSSFQDTKIVPGNIWNYNNTRGTVSSSGKW